MYEVKLRMEHDVDDVNDECKKKTIEMRSIRQIRQSLSMILRTIFIYAGGCDAFIAVAEISMFTSIHVDRQ